jgi:hypothetical protein
LGCEPGRGAAILFVTAAFSCSSSAKSFSISLYEEILGIFLSIVMMDDGAGFFCCRDINVKK